MLMRKKMKQRVRGILAVCSATCMMLTGIPFGSLQVWAEDTATVTNIYATFPESGEPTDFEVAEEGYQTVENDNATVTYPAEFTVNPYEILMSGNSSLITDTYTVSSNSEAYSSDSLTNDNINEFIESYNNQPPYSFTFTANTTWTGWLQIDTLTVNSGVTLTIACGIDGENPIARL